MTLLEYGDCECPHRGVAHAFIESVRPRINDDLRFAFRHCPLGAIHPRAKRAAEAAEAAGEQGQFWAMHDLLFENQCALDDDDLLLYAEELGIDVPRFARQLAVTGHASRVRDDYRSGIESGVTGTPTFFVNTARHLGACNGDSLVKAIERARPQPITPLPGSDVRT